MGRRSEVRLGALVLLMTIASGQSSFCNQTCQEDMEKSYLANIQEKLLSSLHLRAPLQNISGPKLTEEQIQELLGSDYDKEEFEEKKVVVLPSRCDVDVPGCVAFHVSHSTLSSVVRVNLRFFLSLEQFSNLEMQSGDESLVTLTVRRVYLDGTQEEVLTEKVEMLKTSDKWDIDLSVEEIKGWKEQQVAGLTITAEHDSESHLINEGVVSGNPTLGPTLLLWAEPPLRRDRRHSEHYCPPESNENICCLHDMIIDFAKLGWTFIMAPKRYNAFMCRGICHYTNNHALRYGHSKLIKDATLGTTHCCHPSEYESLKIIYTRSDNEIVITRVPGMIARRCACT